jgi:hypothetical protein
MRAEGRRQRTEGRGQNYTPIQGLVALNGKIYGRDRSLYNLLLITYYLLLITYYLLLITYNLLLITYYLLLITYNLLLITYYLLLITCYDLPDSL